jgi:hypothetical protein
MKNNGSCFNLYSTPFTENVLLNLPWLRCEKEANIKTKTTPQRFEWLMVQLREAKKMRGKLLRCC